MADRLSYGFDNDLIALWNEPGFLSPFIFTHCDRPDLTAEYVGRLRRSNFTLENGYCDNEDSGAMGSWYVFTGIGLFPNAGQDFYYLLPPAYDEVTLHLSSGRNLHITHEKGQGPLKIYVDGKPLKEPVIRHKDLISASELRFCHN